MTHPTDSALIGRAMDRISDVLQVPLVMGQDGLITGWRTGSLAPLPQLKMFIAVSIKAQLVSKDHLAVLAHVDGNLFALVTVHLASVNTAVFMLDNNKLKGQFPKPEDMLPAKSGILDVLKGLKAGLVASLAWDKGWMAMPMSS